MRCPACDFTGEDSLFNEGCPVCGYSVERETFDLNDVHWEDHSDPKEASGNLPVWAYILTAAVFTAVMAALLFTVS